MEAGLVFKGRAEIGVIADMKLSIKSFDDVNKTFEFNQVLTMQGKVVNNEEGVGRFENNIKGYVLNFEANHVVYEGIYNTTTGEYSGDAELKNNPFCSSGNFELQRS
jgi:hypothetical protein